jgi:SAM-dependent methyltransferase
MAMKKYKPRNHGENRMSHEGDVTRAREYFYNKKTYNLAYLLKKRYNWMNKFISKSDKGIEVGCGTGVSKEYIKSDKYFISDYTDNDWLDYKMIDALSTGFEDNTFDFIISSNMVHHVPYPIKFFDEMERIIKPGGKLIIQEINCSLSMQYLLRIMRHEGFDFTINVFDKSIICTDPNDLWSANCAIPNLLFDNKEKFESNVKNFKIIEYSYSEFFTFINSGGVISKTFFIPLPIFLLKIVDQIDILLTKLFPKIFALQRQIVLEKK